MNSRVLIFRKYAGSKPLDSTPAVEKFVHDDQVATVVQDMLDTGYVLEWEYFADENGNII